MLGTLGCKYGHLDYNFWNAKEKLTELEKWTLERPFTGIEVKEAVFASEPNGTPGSDGFTFQFYQFFWKIVKSDLMLLTHFFYENQLNLHRINKSCICLIPKENDATHIKKFRPISLVNCSFKIISKILTIRLEQIMDRLIDTSQSAFIKNRYILDNMILGQEILHSSFVNKQPGVVIKIDFEKTYDKIHWDYLIEILKSRNFELKWIQWITQWLYSSQSCLIVNEGLTKYFYCKRGVRQGDPLSPFLYILAADTLSKLFTKGRNANLVRGL